MYAVNVTIKVQNKLAKNSIMLSLKQWSEYLFKAGNGLIFRCFLDRSENQIDVFHVFESKFHVDKARKENSEEFWKQIMDMGGHVSRIEGPCEVEMKSDLNNLKFNFKK